MLLRIAPAVASAVWLLELRPPLFVPVLLADLWLLGDPHVAATFTQLVFDGGSARRYRWPWTALSLGTLGATVALGAHDAGDAITWRRPRPRPST